MNKDQLISTIAHWFQGMTTNDQHALLTDAQSLALAADLVDYVGDWYTEKTITPTIVTNLIRISMNLLTPTTTALALFFNNQIRCFFNIEL